MPKYQTAPTCFHYLILWLVVLVLAHGSNGTSTNRAVSEAGLVETKSNPLQAVINASAPLAVVLSSFASFTIEISQLYIPGRHCNFTSPRVQQMARNLEPERIRVGGTRGDTFWYYTGSEPAPLPPPPYETTFTSADFDIAADFARAVGAKIAFGANAGEGPRASSPSGAWTPNNLEVLLQYIVESDAPVMGFEFGNEPNLYRFKFGPQAVVSPTQYAADLQLFASTVRSYNDSWYIIAADVDYAPVVGEIGLFDNQFLPTAGPFLDAFSYHFYPLMYNRSGNIPGILKPLNCTADHLLSPITLNRVHYWAKRVTSLGQKYAPHAEVWLGETGSCVGGGGDGISDRFVDAMEFVDKLGQVSKFGQSTVMRQTFCDSPEKEYAYALVSYNGTYHPTAWAFVLHKQLVGQTVLDMSISHADLHRNARVYAFCARNGGVVVTSVNLSTKDELEFNVSLAASASGGLGNSFDIYVLTPGEKGVASDHVFLNSATTPLRLDVNGTLPPLPPAVVQGTAVSQPPLSISFAHFTQANVAACSLGEF